jgi:hypothetical protein
MEERKTAIQAKKPEYNKRYNSQAKVKEYLGNYYIDHLKETVVCPHCDKQILKLALNITKQAELKCRIKQMDK